MAASSSSPLTPNLNFDAAGARPITDDDLTFMLGWRGLPIAAASEAQKHAAREHVMAAWKDAKSSAHVYRCVQSLSFLKPRAALHPTYATLVAEATAGVAEYRIADVGAAFGQDTRRLIMDGVSPGSILPVDITSVYWRAGELIFDGVVEGLPPPIAASPSLLVGDWAVPVDTAPACSAAPYFGSLNAALCMFVLHVLSREQSAALLRTLAACLRPGGLLLGSAVGAAVAGAWALTPDGTQSRWLHSAESLTAELAAAGFTDVVVGADSHPWEAGAVPIPPPSSVSVPSAGAGGSGGSDPALRLQFSARRA